MAMKIVHKPILVKLCSHFFLLITLDQYILFNFESANRGRNMNYPPYGLGLISSHLELINIQNEVLNKKRIVEKFGIHPTNFALARAIVGDKSDNLDGIKGVGLPTIAKRLPFLAEEKTYSIDEVTSFCENSNSTLKV